MTVETKSMVDTIAYRVRIDLASRRNAGFVRHLVE